MHYGDIDIDPAHLAIWYIFRTEGELSAAQTSDMTEHVAAWTREELTSKKYPRDAVEAVGVSFGSDEGIKDAGGFREYFA